jgi:hypothetical protein
MTNRFDEAWRVFAERDRRLQAPPHLEQRILTALKQARSAKPTASPPHRSLAWLAVAATLAVAVAGGIMLRDHPSPASKLLHARAHPVVMWPAPAAMVAPPVRTAAPPRRRSAVDQIAYEDDQHIILMMFDATPSLPSEPLQLVRLRIPREALLGLGMSLFEAGTEGTVDVDVLVGEDGLPKDIRKVRVTQEER